MGIFAGCANKEATATNSLEEIKSSGVLQVGTEGTYAHFTFHDETGKLTGFDVEISEEVAKRLGVKAEFIETKWDGMFADLDAKRFQMVANQVGINDKRKAKYDFSDPYIVSGAVLIVSEDNTAITKFEDLAGKKSGQSLTSNLSKIATSYGAELVTVDGFNQAIDLILSGRIDATVNESLSFLDYKKQKPDTPIKIVAKLEAQDQNAFLFNKGNEELVAAVNAALKAMKVAIPPLSNSFISLVKDTSLAAAITVPEMFQIAQRITARTYEPLWLYTEAALIYLMISTVLTIMQSKLEVKFSKYE